MHSYTLRTARFILALALGGLVAGCVSCMRAAGPQTADKVSPAPRNVVLPPGGAETPPADKAANDQTLVLLANIASTQDKLLARLETLDERHTQLRATVEAQDKQAHQTGTSAAQNVQALNEQLKTLQAKLSTLEQHRSSAPDTAAIPPGTTAAAAASVALPPGSPTGPTVTYIAPAAAESPTQRVNNGLRTQVRAAYERVIKEAPQSAQAVEALLGLAALSEEEKDFDRACAYYEQVLQRKPAPALEFTTRSRLGQALLDKGSCEAARAAFLLAADSQPRLPQAVTALLSAADCLAQLGKTDQALREYHAIERAYTGTAFAQQARERSGALLLKEKRFAEAVETYTTSLQATDAGGKAACEVHLAAALTGAGRAPEALEVLRRILQQPIDADLQPSVYWELARAEEETGQALDAGRSYLHIAEHFPDHPLGLQSRISAVRAFLGAELYVHACTQAENTVQILRNTAGGAGRQLLPEALYISARAHRLAAGSAGAEEKARLQQVMEDRLRELRLEYPTHARTLDAEIEEADLLAQNGHPDEAVAYLHQVVRGLPADAAGSSALLLRLAELQERSQNARAGAAAYTELLARMPAGDQAAYLRLKRALSLRDIGQADQAQTALDALSADAKTPKAVAAMACYYSAELAQRAGRLPAAVEKYQQFQDESSGSTALLGLDLSALREEVNWKLLKLKTLIAPAKETDTLAPKTENKNEHST